MDFGQNLKHLREDSHLTQKELGAKLGITAQVVSNLERGVTTNLDPDIIQKMCQVFQISEDSLLGTRKTNSDDRDYSTFIMENTFPEKMKSLMAEKQIDTGLLSEATGISESRLDEYVYSRRQPMAEDLIKLSGYFNVSIDWLLDNSRRKDFSQDEEKLLYYFEGMSPECRELILSEAFLVYVKGIAGVAAPSYNAQGAPEKKACPSSGTEGKRTA